MLKLNGTDEKEKTKNKKTRYCMMCHVFEEVETFNITHTA